MGTSARGLGRGLDALFEGSAQQRALAEPPTSLPLSALVANPAQPRRTFTEAALDELADSIRQQGIIQPLLVRPLEDGARFQIVAGERRWRAAAKAGLSEVPVYVRAMDEQEAMAAALIENLQREDLNPVEEAEALGALRDTLGLTQEELAARLGRSRPAVANALRQRIVLTGMTVREAEEAVAHLRDTGVFPWEAANAEPASVESKGATARKPLAEPLADLRERLASALERKVRISGTPLKGKITLAYTSPEDLEALLARLGVASDPEK